MGAAVGLNVGGELGEVDGAAVGDDVVLVGALLGGFVGA